MQCDGPSWHLVPLILAISIGSHATTHALAPAEPKLAEIGVGPIAYALLSLVPTLGQICTPAIWGWAFATWTRRIVVLAPCMLLVGQSFVTLGLGLDASGLPGAGLPLLVGLLVTSGSKAGLGVISHACLALVLVPRDEVRATGWSALPKYSSFRRPRRLMMGICITIATTHMIGAVTTYAVPRILKEHGLFTLQLCLLLPCCLGGLSGWALSAVLPVPPLPPLPPPEPKRYEAFTVRCSSCVDVIYRPLPFADQVCDRCRTAAAQLRAQNRALFSLALWRASAVGCIHALSMVTVALLVSHSWSASEAGTLVALSSTASLFCLPLILLCSAHMIPLLGVLSLGVLACIGMLALAQEIGGNTAPWGSSTGGDATVASAGADPAYSDFMHLGSKSVDLGTSSADVPLGPPWLLWALPRAALYGMSFCSVLPPPDTSLLSPSPRVQPRP